MKRFLCLLVSCFVAMSLTPTDLSSGERPAQTSLLRPTDHDGDPHGDGWDPTAPVAHDCGGPTSSVCVHWVTSSEDAPSTADVGPADGTPDWINTMLTSAQRALKMAATNGFRKPKGDGELGASDAPSDLDLYVVDLEGASFGYCSRDPDQRGQARHVYCVFDNDYARDDYCPCPPNPFGENALRVTVAHEIFHAIHCAYDCSMPPWVSEGTATWFEDVVWDQIDDNYWYLDDSVLIRPGVSLTDSDGDADPEYAAWLFWRFLSERYGTKFVVRFWEEEASDRSRAAPLRSLDSLLRDRNTTFAATFGRFAGLSYFYETAPANGGAYEEGAAYAQHLETETGLPMRPPARRHSLGPRGRGSGKVQIAELAHAYASFTRTARTPAGADLSLRASLPRGGVAYAVVRRTDGRVRTWRLVRDGRRVSARVPFGAGVDEVVLSLTNATGSREGFGYGGRVL